MFPDPIFPDEEIEILFSNQSNDDDGNDDHEVDETRQEGNSVFIPFSGDSRAMSEKIRSTLSNLPYHLRSVPAMIGKLATEFKPTAPTIVNGKAVYVLLEKSVKNGEKFITARIKTFQQLPKLGGVVGGLFSLLKFFSALFLLSPSFGFFPLFFPLAPVDAGMEENWLFNYVVMPLCLLYKASTFVVMSNFATPEAKTPKSFSILTIFMSSGFGFGYYYLMLMGYIRQRPRFPVPFASVQTGLATTLVVPIFLYLFTPKKTRCVYKSFVLFLVFLSFWFALLVAMSWAALLTIKQEDTRWVVGLGLAYPILKFFCKIVVTGNLTALLGTSKWIHLNLVVNILFTATLCMIYPLISTWARFIIISACDLSIVIFRLYYGVGRINAMWTQLRQNNTRFMTTIAICISIRTELLLDLPFGSILSNGTAATADEDDDFSQPPMGSNKDRPRLQILGRDSNGDRHDVEVNMNDSDDDDDDDESIKSVQNPTTKISSDNIRGKSKPNSLKININTILMDATCIRLWTQ